MTANLSRSSREILALFVQARRKFNDLKPTDLAASLPVTAKQVMAAERGAPIAREAALALGRWCEIAPLEVGGGWVDVTQTRKGNEDGQVKIGNQGT